MNSLRCTLFGLAVLPVLTSVTATAQTESQLDQRYTRLKAYSVRPNILLTVTVDRTGRVCEMVLEPHSWHRWKNAQRLGWHAGHLAEEPFPPPRKWLSKIESDYGSVLTPRKWPVIAKGHGSTVVH